MSTVVLTAIITGILSGGLFTAAATLYKARKTVPAERDNLVVTGAETAVLSLERSLAAETRRAERAEAAVVMRDEVIAEKERRIAALERRIDEVQAKLDSVRAELHQIRMSP